MPTGTPYSNKLHGVLKEAYGDKFVLTEDQFFDKMTNDPAYQDKIYGILKDAYKNDFTLTPKQFYDQLKKKEGTTENLQIPSQLGGRAFTKSSEGLDLSVKKPYQDISYKKEPLQADVISTQVPKPIQKAVTTGGKVSPAAANPRIIEDDAFRASVIQSTADPVQKDLFNYDMYADEYDRLEKVNGASEKEVINNIRKYDPELWQELSQGITDQMVGNGGLGENLSIDDFRTASKAVYQRYLSLLDENKKKLSESNVKSNKAIDEIVKEKINEKTFEQYIKPDVNYKNTEAVVIDGRSVSVPKAVASGQKVIDVDKINALATEIVESYNLKDDGKAWQLVFNKLKAQADYEIDRGRANQILAEKYPESAKNLERIKTESAKIAGMTPEQFSEYWTDDDAILARYDSLAKSASDNALKDAEMEASVFINDYTYNQKRVDDEYKNKQNELSAQADAFTEMRRLEQIDDLTYKQAIAAIEGQLEEAYKKYEQDYQGLDQYVKSANEVYSRYNKKLKMELESIQEKADSEISDAFNKYIAMFEDPTVLSKIQDDYSKAHQEAALDRAKLMGNAAYENSAFTYFLRSTKQALGGVISGYGGYFDSKLLKVLGETVAQNNKLEQAKTENFSDLLDGRNFLNLTGQLGGSMAPGMLATATVATMTGGAGVPTIVPMIAGGVTGWLTESMDIAGRAYNDMFEKTNGDVEKASAAFREAFNSQYDLMGTYAFSALPYVGGAMSKISGAVAKGAAKVAGSGAGKAVTKVMDTKAGRVVAGASAEYTEEYIQEFNQGIAEENISEGRDAWSGWAEKIKDPKRHKENAITLIPTMGFGALGQVRSKSPGQQAADAYMAIDQKTRINPAFKDQQRQYIQSVVFERNAEFAKSMISTLFAAGKIDETKAGDMLIEVERAQRIKDSADAAKLKGDNRIVYSFFASRAEDAERSAKIFHNDPIMSKVFEQQAKDYQQAGIDFLNGKTPELYSITFADGSQNLMTQADMADIMQSEEALDVISEGNVQISSYGSKTGSNSLETLREKVAQYEENKKVTEEKKLYGDTYNNTIDVLNAIKNNEDYKDKITSHPSWSTLTVEEQDEVMLLTERLSKFEREKAATDAVGVESANLDEKIKTAKQDLSNLLNREPNDNKNVPGVSSEIGEGKKPVEEEPVEGTGTETTEAGGVLQAPEEEITPPTQEQILDDIKNKRLSTFTYNSESEVPDNLKSKISSTGEINGKPFVKVTLAQSEAEYELAKANQAQEEVTSTTEAAPEVTSENEVETTAKTLESAYKDQDKFGVLKHLTGALRSNLVDIEYLLADEESVENAEVYGKIKEIGNSITEDMEAMEKDGFSGSFDEVRQQFEDRFNEAKALVETLPKYKEVKDLLSQFESVSNESVSNWIKTNSAYKAGKYYEAKTAGSNPQLVKEVEDLIGKTAEEAAPVAEEPAKPKGKKKAEPKAEKPKRQQVEESLKKLRDQGLLVTADTSLLAKAKKLVGKKPKPVPMSDKEIAAQMKLLDAMAKVWKNVSGQDTFYDEFINEVKKGDLKKLQELGGVLYQEEGDEKLAMPFKARVTLGIFNLPQFKLMEGKMVAAQNVKDMVKTKAKPRGEKPVLEMVLDSPKYKDQKRFSFDEFKTDVEIAVMNFEKHYTSSYANYGMDNLGSKDIYGKSKTIVFNAPVSHGYSGHWNNIYDPAAFSARNWVLREVPERPGLYVAWDNYAPTGIGEDQLMNYVGTAGTRDHVEKWITDIKNIGNDRNKLKVGLFGHIRAWQEGDKFYVAELQSDTHQKYQKAMNRPLNEEAFVRDPGQQAVADYVRDEFFPTVLTENQKHLPVYDKILKEGGVEIVENDLGDRWYALKVPTTDGTRMIPLASLEELNRLAEDAVNNLLARPNFERDYADVDRYGPLRDMVHQSAIGTMISDGSFLVKPQELDGPDYRYGAFMFMASDIPSANNINYQDYAQPTVIKFVNQEQFDAFQQAYEKLITATDEIRLSLIRVTGDVKDVTNTRKFKEDVRKFELAILKSMGGMNYEKQFLDLDKNYMTRLVRESIRLAAEAGAKTMLIPSPLTLAKIEGYSTPSANNDQTDRMIPYETPDGTDADLVVGDVIKIADTEYIVLEANATDIKVAEQDKVFTRDVYEYANEMAWNDVSEIEYELRRALEKAGREYNSKRITQEDIDAIEGYEFDFYSGLQTLMQNELDRTSRRFELLEEYEQVEPESIPYITWDDVTDDVAQELTDNNMTMDASDLFGTEVFETNRSGEYYSLEWNAEVFEYRQPDQYDEKPVVVDEQGQIDREKSFEESFRDDLPAEQATVVQKYINLRDDFKKLRPDAKPFIDENRNVWYETQITPEDLDNPIIAFQKEGEKAKAAIDFTIDQKATVHIFKGADISSLAHEMTGHIGRRVLERLAAQNADFAKDYEATKKWAGVDGDLWNTAAEEKFARGFERYLRSGKAPNKSLQSVFNKLREWFSNIYEQIKGGSIDVNITPRMKKVFDNLLAYKPEPKTETKTKAETKTEEVKRKPKQEILDKAKRLADLYREIKSGNVSVRPELDDLLDNNPKLKYLYKNLPSINAKLEKDGLITKKTDGCP